jgi:Tol biopolymer transport system component
MVRSIQFGLLAVLAIVILGCGGGGGGTTVHDYIYHKSANSVVRQDYPTGNLTILFTMNGGWEYLRVSPDGAKILASLAGVLEVRNVDGSGRVVLSGYKMGDWNADGTKIYALSNTNRIRSMNVDGTGVSGDLFNGSTFTIGSLDVNDAGTKIVFDWPHAGVSQLQVMNVDGSGRTEITHAGAPSVLPRWSHDGTEIVFVRNVDIYKIDADGATFTQLRGTSAVETQPVYRRDGKIVYVSDGDLWKVEGNGGLPALIYDGGATSQLWPDFQ